LQKIKEENYYYKDEEKEDEGVRYLQDIQFTHQYYLPKRRIFIGARKRLGKR
jgi:hypothetical protein